MVDISKQKEIVLDNISYLLYELNDTTSWDKQFPTHLTYDIPDIGKVSEPFYMPIWDDKDSIRSKYNIVGYCIDNPQFTTIIEENSFNKEKTLILQLK